MTPPSAARLPRILTVLVPTGIRKAFVRRRLRRRHGLRALGPDFDYQIASNTTFEPNCRLGGPAYIAGSSIGAYTYIEVGCRISLTDVGRFCSIAPYSVIGLAEHPVHEFVSTHPLFYRRLPQFGYDLVSQDQHQELTRTTIGNDVWIGVGACVRGGLTIGDGAVIGAGAVVTRDVEPYEVVGGVPATTIRYRFDHDTRQALMRTRWWDHDLDWLREHADEFRDVDGFLRQRDAEQASSSRPVQVDVHDG